MQAARVGEFAGPLACVGAVVRSDGLGGLLFRGLGVTLLREVPSFGLYFLAYEWTKATLLGLAAASWPGVAWLPGLVPLIAGAAAGAAAWIPVYPIDVVKTNIQISTDSGRNESALAAAQR